MTLAYPGHTDSQPRSMAGNTTSNDTAPFTGVELYALVAGASLLLSFGLLGSLSSLALLLAPKCKSSLRALAYGLPYTLAGTNLVLCLLWVPIDVVRLILNYCAYGLHEYICFADLTLFHFALSTIVCLNVFIVLHRLTASCWEQAQTACVLVGIVFSLALGILCVNVSLVDYHQSWDYAICTQTFQSPRSGQHTTTLLLTVGWVVTLLLFIAIVAAILFRQRRALDAMTRPAQNSIPMQNATTPVCVEREPSKVHFLEPSSSRDEKSSSKTSLGEAIFPSLFGGKDSNKNKSKDEEKESEIDDDEFDQRMKFQVQKSGSGRRHTVANIGFGESLFAPRREGASSKPTSPTTGGGYQYVRKWSVDIQALQDQLENPKAHTEANPFTQFSASKSQQNGHKEQDNGKEEQRTDKVNQIDELPEKDECKVDEEKPDKPSQEEETLLPAVQIVKPDGVANSKQTSIEPAPAEHANMVVPLIAVDEPAAVDDSTRKQRVQAMQQTMVCLLLLLVVFFCVLPFSLVQWLQGITRPVLNRNISIIASVGCVLQTVVHTFLIAWMERRIWQALRRLRIILTHWKCVCYCNIGKGKNCFKHPHYNGRSISA